MARKQGTKTNTNLMARTLPYLKKRLEMYREFVSDLEVVIKEKEYAHECRINRSRR